MKIVIVNPKISLNKKRRAINDVIDQALNTWLINNSYYPIVLPNSTIKIKKKKIELFLKRLKPKGIVLSGGNDVTKNSLRYSMQLFLIQFSKSNRIPLLGICQGMQMLGVSDGAKLIRVKNHVRAKHLLVNLTNEKFPIEVNSYHDYSLKKCPRNYRVTTITNTGDIESIKHKKYFIEGWMWHPERDIKINKINNYRLKKLFK